VRGTQSRVGIVIEDQTGWHMSSRLAVPPTITLLPLPPECPELNPTENIWELMRDNWLSNRIYKSYDDITAAIPGTSSSISHGASCPSGCATGLMGFSQ